MKPTISHVNPKTNRQTKRTSVSLFLVVISWLTLAYAHAQSIPPLINYQGRLTDGSGAPLPRGAYGVAFRLWDQQSLAASQTLIWGREYDVTIIEGGVFNVILGAPGGRLLADNPASAVHDLAFAFGASNRFIGLTITRDAGGQAVSQPKEFVPRQQILSAPFALMAQNLAQGTLTPANVDPAFLLDILQPPGTISAFGGANIPPGWLLCDGRAISSNSFPRLFMAIGTNWGAGSLAGNENFNLPDLRGLFLRGVDGTAGRDLDTNLRTTSSPGGAIGNSVGSFQMDQFGAHFHGPPNGVQFLTQIGPPNAGLAAPGGAGSVSPTTDTRGGTETRPKNAYVNYIIKY